MFVKRRKIVAPVATEKSSIPDFEELEFEKKVMEEEAITSAITILLELGPDYYLPFFIFSANKEARKNLGERLVTEEDWNAAMNTEDGPKYENQKWSDRLTDYTWNSICKAARRMSGCVVYSNDGGKAAAAFAGMGTPNDGNWEVKDGTKPHHVVPIKSRQALSHLLFCSSVDIGAKQQVVKIAKASYTVSVPSYKGRNVVPGSVVPFEIKELFQSLLAFASDSDTVTVELIEKTRFIWEAIGQTYHGKVLPCNGFDPTFAYFSLIRKVFSFKPSPIDINDVFYKPYPFLVKELVSTLLNNSVYRGGVKVNKYHFLDFGLGLLSHRHLGGAIPVKWCSYNTRKDVVWEREGAYLADTRLNNRIEAVRSVVDFDGCWYDPNHATVRELTKSSAIIVPYDSRGNNMSIALDWMDLFSGEKFHVWASYGAAPCLWVEREKFVTDAKTKLKCKVWVEAELSILWKTLPTMSFFNLTSCCNDLFILNLVNNGNGERANLEDQFRENGCDWRIVSVAELTAERLVDYNWTDAKGKDHGLRVPEVLIYFVLPDFLPGRHFIATERKVTDAERGRRFFETYARHFSTDAEMRDAPSDPDSAKSKRPKTS